MLRVEADGKLYDNIISFEVFASVLSIARSFTIVTARPENEPLPFKGGQIIKICDDEDILCHGYIDKVQPRYSKNSHTVILSGRSFAQDLIDSSLLPIEFSNSLSLSRIIELILEQIGIKLLVVNGVFGLENFNIAEDRIAVSPGQNAFEFIDSLARKRQVLLTSDEQGNILIERSGVGVNNGTIFNKLSGDSNVLSSFASYDSTKTFNKYVYLSQKNTTVAQYNSDPGEAVDQDGFSFDGQVRPRQFVAIAEKSSSSAELKKRADWKNNISRANSVIYTVIMQGSRKIDGSIWDINKLQNVDDDFADIQETMLASSITYRQSKDSGTTTEINFVDKNAYDQIKPDEIKEVGNGLFD